ncbi:hypothetical protein TPA0910_57450 [Streptomyces hygroscopicus subsp. sporocinereus]|uniref:Uncharacterized protein n=1 Tax=Streptomyces hygroscopicus TaxID=1912 RepID=A0ABQ3U6T1_STRHY|nr:hypothetical protein TPA0910_57450 [Streptomyces hygroscopicus]
MPPDHGVEGGGEGELDFELFGGQVLSGAGGGASTGPGQDRLSPPIRLRGDAPAVESEAAGHEGRQPVEPP